VLLPSLTVIIAVRQLLDVEHITNPDPACLLNDNTDILATFLVNSSTVSTKKQSQIIFSTILVWTDEIL